MNKKIEEILKKYSYIEFVNNDDKIIFIDFLWKISDELENNNLDKIIDFIDMLEYDLLKYSKFDKSILYNPFKLFESIIDNDLLWKKIDDDEFFKMINNFNFFKDYLEKKVKEKEYLEKVYWIEIKLITDNIYSISAWIFWKWLWEIISNNIILKLKKLLDFYPINYIKNIKLEWIFILEYFYKEDEYWNKDILWWFKTHLDNNIYLSRENLLDSFDHELYHQAMEYYDDFDEWFKIRKTQNKKYLYKDIDKRVIWFARNYWKENVSEDQATVAEELILNYNYLKNRIKTDKKLFLKVKLVKKAFFVLSEWIIDEKWWEEKFN